MREVALLLVAILMTLLGAWEWDLVGVVVAVFVTALVFRGFLISMPKRCRMLFNWARATLAAARRRR